VRSSDVGRRLRNLPGGGRRRPDDRDDQTGQRAVAQERILMAAGREEAGEERKSERQWEGEHVEHENEAAHVRARELQVLVHGQL